MLTWHTAGESHGKGLTAFLDGIPAGLVLTANDLLDDLRRRQGGYGRGGRMKIERDAAEITAGVRGGVTLGSPIALWIENKDWKNWQDAMDPERPASGPKSRKVTAPRPGHADLAGYYKFGHDDLRNVLERASARETAARVAIGAVCRQFLSAFGVEVASEVLQIGGVGLEAAQWMSRNPVAGRDAIESSQVRCGDEEASRAMISRIDEAFAQRDTLGGLFLVFATGVPPGLGSYTQHHRRLDARLGAAMMGIPAIKGVEIGLGFEAARRFGSEVHDPIVRDDDGGVTRSRNHAGGLEGGTTNGQPLIVHAAMKPISTLSDPLPSVDIQTGDETGAAVERSDACAVPAAAVVGEAMMCIELARAWREKFGGDSMEEIRATVDAYRVLVQKRTP